MDISHASGCLEIDVHHSDAPFMESASRAAVGINSADAAAVTWAGLIRIHLLVRGSDFGSRMWK